MTRLRCSSLFRVYQPLEEYRTVCSKVLVVCSGQHTHPIPLPTKTPPHIRNEIFNILRHMDYDLPDLTPRRFLRHPSLLKYVESQLSNCHHPTLTDVHISLANRDHLRSYITHVQKLSFPLGTGWRGVYLANDWMRWFHHLLTFMCCDRIATPQKCARFGAAARAPLRSTCH